MPVAEVGAVAGDGSDNPLALALTLLPHTRHMNPNHPLLKHSRPVGDITPLSSTDLAWARWVDT